MSNMDMYVCGTRTHAVVPLPVLCVLCTSSPPPCAFPFALPPGVRPADLLYVSYTNVAGGVLPYIIMLHRPSKSIVLSVRGTGEQAAGGPPPGVHPALSCTTPPNPATAASLASMRATCPRGCT